LVAIDGFGRDEGLAKLHLVATLDRQGSVILVGWATAGQPLHFWEVQVEDILWIR